MLGQRGAFGAALDRLAAANEKIFALSADLRNTSGLDRFAKNYPADLRISGSPNKIWLESPQDWRIRDITSLPPRLPILPL
jgi:hypothetical protein